MAEGTASPVQDVLVRLIAAFSDALTGLASTKGGQLTASEIAEAGRRFAAQSSILEPLAGEIATLSREAIHAEIAEEQRRDHFGRILVSRFDHLLAPRTGGPADGGAISRATLDRFFLVLHKMLGDDTIKALNDQCALIVERVREARKVAGKPFQWDVLLQDPEITLLVRRVMARIALHFEAYDRRKTWFIDCINSQLEVPAPAPADPEHPVTPPWHFTDHHFTRMMAALFADLKTALADPAAIRDIDAELGPGTGSKIQVIMQRLATDAANG